MHDRRRKRCKTILKRFDAKQLEIPPLQVIQDECKAAPEKLEEDLEGDMFDEVLVGMV